ncbi:MAG: DEAD/DEAH box helicase family protein, partial [Prevotella sp.]|nr:DEAD/DEAH box helicase family protein [Prevotella sp.]
MENISNIQILDNLIVGRVDPQIYAFSTQTIPNYLKVGDTYRPVEIRLDEWRKFFPNLEKVFSEIAKVDDSVYFRDYEVHHFLVNDVGRERLTPDIFPDRPYSQEFFKEATVKDIKDAIDDIHYSYEKGISKYHFYRDGTPVVFHYNHEEDYPPRPNQAATIEKFKAAYKNCRHNLLMYAVMRFGKSFTSMCCAVEMDARLVIVVSGKADVKDEWKKTVEGHKKFVDYEYLIGEDLLRDNNILSNTLKEKRAVLFLTLQDLSGDKIKKKHQEIFENKIDLLIIDETHFGARAKEYGKVLTENKVFMSERQAARELFDSDNSLDEVDKMTKTLNAKMRIHLSGTPYRILMGSEFSKEDIIAFYQFSDIVKDQEEYDKEHLLDVDYKEWDNPYYGFPQMIRFAFNPNKSSIGKMESMRKKGITYAFSALFKPCSIDKDNSHDKKHCFFENEKEIMDLLMVIDGTKEDTNVLGFLDYDKIREGKLCRHIVCVLPYCASCDALENLINKNADTFKNLREYTVINISGWENTAYKTIESVKNKIKQLESNNKKSLTLTVNKMLTGCTVPEWDTMIFLKDTASPQEYDQAIFRLQNQYIKRYTDDKGNIIKYNMKPQTLLVDFDP